MPFDNVPSDVLEALGRLQSGSKEDLVKAVTSAVALQFVRRVLHGVPRDVVFSPVSAAAAAGGGSVDDAAVHRLHQQLLTSGMPYGSLLAASERLDFLLMHLPPAVHAAIVNGSALAEAPQTTESQLAHEMSVLRRLREVLLDGARPFPAALAATDAAAAPAGTSPHDRDAVPAWARTDYSEAELQTLLPHRWMRRLRLDRSSPLPVQVVLQGEGGVVISTPAPLSPSCAPPLEASAVDAAAAAGHFTSRWFSATASQPSYIVSPDATTCVLVACRVTMREAARLDLARLAPAVDRAVGGPWSPDGAGVVGGAVEGVRALLHGLVARHPVSPLLSYVGLTATAAGATGRLEEGLWELVKYAALCSSSAMIHADQVEQLERMLEDMVWSVAIPAWIYAALEGFRAVVESGAAADPGQPRPAAGGGGGTTPPEERQRRGAAAELADLLASVIRCVSGERAGVGVLTVQWYVVGGMVCATHSLPTLAAVFAAFFGAEAGAAGSSALLRPSETLGRLLALPTGGGAAGGCDALARRPLRVQHLLDERGCCFWSLNTFVKRWEAGPTPVSVYSCVTWGLLVRNHLYGGDDGAVEVDGRGQPVLDRGTCWPVEVAPGTRHYPLAGVRHVSQGRPLRWTCPTTAEAPLDALHRTSADPGADEHDDDAGGTGRALRGLLVVQRGVRSRGAATRLPAPLLTAQSEPYSLVSLGSIVRLSVCRAGSPPPVLLRRGSWRRENGDLLRKVHDAQLLMFSTSPHCEPRDFPAVVRTGLAVQVGVDWKEVFVPATAAVAVDWAGGPVAGLLV